jgi:hypothetical protein
LNSETCSSVRESAWTGELAGCKHEGGGKVAAVGGWAWWWGGAGLRTMLICGWAATSKTGVGIGWQSGERATVEAGGGAEDEVGAEERGDK